MAAPAASAAFADDHGNLRRADDHNQEDEQSSGYAEYICVRAIFCFFPFLFLFFGNFFFLLGVFTSLVGSL